MAKLNMSSVNSSKSLSLIQVNKGNEVSQLKPYLTRVGGNYDFTIGGNWALEKGHTYEVEVLFRPRGDGISTVSRCSSIGFITWWDNWNRAYSYIHWSALAYEEQGKFVRYVYRFTAQEDVQPQGTGLFFIIDNYYGNGSDNQTIDLYYYRYQDLSNPSQVDEKGTNFQFIEFTEDTGETYVALAYQSSRIDKNEFTFICQDSEGKEKYYVPFSSDYDTTITGLNCNIISEGNSTISVGNLYKFLIKNFTKLNITINPNPTSTTYCNAMFYDSWKEEKDWVDRQEGAFTYSYLETVRRTQIGTKLVNDVSTLSNIYVYLNDEIIHTQASTEGGEININVRPGDIVYLKIVNAVGGQIVYNQSVYGQQTTVYQEYSAWNGYYWDEDIEDYLVNEDEITSAILSGNESYGYVTEAGDGTLSETEGFGTGYGSTSNVVSISSSLLNYEEIIDLVRGN